MCLFPHFSYLSFHTKWKAFTCLVSQLERRTFLFKKIERIVIKDDVIVPNVWGSGMWWRGEWEGRGRGWGWRMFNLRHCLEWTTKQPTTNKESKQITGRSFIRAYFNYSNYKQCLKPYPYFINLSINFFILHFQTKQKHAKKKHRTNYSKNSFAFSGVKIWNAVPSYLKEETSWERLKTKIKLQTVCTSNM